MIANVINKIVEFKCVSCGTLQSYVSLNRTRPMRGTWRGKLEYVSCANCGTGLRIRKGRNLLVGCLSIVTFLCCAILGSFIAMRVPGLCCSGNGGANFLGFLAILIFCVLPATLFCSRFLKLESVE